MKKGEACWAQGGDSDVIRAPENSESVAIVEAALILIYHNTVEMVIEPPKQRGWLEGVSIPESIHSNRGYGG